MSERDRHELKIAGLLHDCGKITTPVHVVDKATKLQTLFDRIDLIDTRFEVARRDAELELCRARLAVAQDGDAKALAEAEREHGARLAAIDADRAFLRQCNNRHRVDAARGPGAGAADRGALPLARSRRRGGAVPHGRRDREPDDPRRHADARGEARHQSPHRRHDPDARSAAVAAAPRARPRIRGRPPRAHGRQGLSARTHPRPDVAAGALHGDRRHLRGAHRRRTGPTRRARRCPSRCASSAGSS